MKEVTKDQQTDALERLKSKVTQLLCYRLMAKRDHLKVMGETTSRMTDWKRGLCNVLHGSTKMHLTFPIFSLESVMI